MSQQAYGQGPYGEGVFGGYPDSLSTVSASSLVNPRPVAANKLPVRPAAMVSFFLAPGSVSGSDSNVNP